MGSHLELDTPVSALPDFWRSQPANVGPDGAADTTEAISHSGLVGVGAGFPATVVPNAAMDVARVGRSGVDGRTANTPLYVTGNIPPMPAFNAAGLPTPVGGTEFRHSNQTQGVGLAWDGIYATGSVANQPLGLLSRGTGLHWKGWQALQGGIYFDDNYGGVAITANQGWNDRYIAGGATEFGVLRRRSARANAGGVGNGNEIYWQGRVDSGAFANFFSIHPSKTQANGRRMEVGENGINDDKLVLFGVDATQFFGFGIRGSELTSWISSAASNWRFRRFPDEYSIMTIFGGGSVIIDEAGQSAGQNLANPGILRFGAQTSSAAIRSPRDAGSGHLQDALIFYAGGAAPRMAVKNNNRIWMAPATIPTFASNAAAIVGGLVQGDIFRDALGGLHIVI